MARKATTTEPSGEAPEAQAAPSAPESTDGQESTTEALPETTARPRCDEVDAAGRQCLYEKHAAKFEHLFEEEAPPKVAAGARSDPVAVTRQSVNVWWCPVCDNAQQQTDRAICRKCGTIPKF